MTIKTLNQDLQVLQAAKNVLQRVNASTVVDRAKLIAAIDAEIEKIDNKLGRQLELTDLFNNA